MFGKAGQDVNALITEWAKGVDNLREQYKKEIIPDEVREALVKSKDASDAARRSLEATVAPWWAAFDLLKLETLDKLAKSIAASLLIIASNADAISKLNAIANIASGGAGGALRGPAGQIEDIDRRIRDLGQSYDDLGRQIAGFEKRAAEPGADISEGQRKFYEGLKKQQADIREQINANSEVAKKLREQQAPTVPGPPAVTVPGGAFQPTPTATGGGGKTDDDNIDAQIRRYKALDEAAKSVAKTISESHATDLADLNREVRVQQQVDEIAAKLGARYNDASKAKKDDLKAAIALYETDKDNNAKQLEYLAKADELERKLGDGTAARAKAQLDLIHAQQAASDAGRTLSPEARNRQAKQDEENIDAQARAASRYSDSLDSLGNGFLNAAAASARAHDAFSVGGQAFNALTDAMGEGIDALVGRSNKGFGQIAADFLVMIAKMTAAAAVSQIFQYLIKAAGLAFSGSQLGAGGQSPAGQLGMNYPGGTPLPGRAIGGPVDAGSPYMVGETGPELFVPRAAGTIVPAGQTGGGVTVNIDMNQTQGAASPSAALDFGRKVRAAVVSVIANEKRPGGSLHPASA